MKIDKLPNAKKIAGALTQHFGLRLSGTSGKQDSDHRYIELVPEGIHQNDGFCVRLSVGWRSLRGEFKPGPFAGLMIEEMGKAPDAKKRLFCDLVKTMLAEKATVTMTVNELHVDPSDVATWPSDWKLLALGFQKSPIAINTEENDNTEDVLLHWSGRFLAGVLALAPLEDVTADQEKNPEGLPEGAIYRVEVNRYERNRYNRAACIEIHGHTCKACGFDFSAVYGEIGRSFVHVHHVTPVSQIGDGYVLNPATDLVPVCANCHSMLHRRNPPLTIDELRNIISIANSD